MSSALELTLELPGSHQVIGSRRKTSRVVTGIQKANGSIVPFLTVAVTLISRLQFQLHNFLQSLEE